MVTRSQKIRLGIFITIGMLLLIGILLLLSIDRFFKQKDIYYIKYHNISVSGLDVGSSVKYLGVRIGTVQDIRINPKNVSEIIVSIAVKKNTPIKKDVTANIAAVGITGLKIIELRGGTPEAPLLKPGGYIQPGKSLTEEITGKAQIIAEKAEMVLNNLIELTNQKNRKKVVNLVEQSRITMSNINHFVTVTEPNLQHVLVNLDSTMANLALASASAKRTLLAIEWMASSDTLKKTLRNIAEVSDKLNKAQIYKFDQQVNLALGYLQNLLRQTDNLVKMNSLRLNQTMEQLSQMVRALNAAAKEIEEDPSVLIGGTKPENPPDEQLKK
jgi:phospholipid/cholesterol/gamma-HCH transport system substrate-binding protein